MSSTTKWVIVFLVILIVLWGGFVILYFYGDIFPEQTSTITTIQTTSVSITASQTTAALTSDELVYMQYLDYYDEMVMVSANTINNLLANSQISNSDWIQQIADEAGMMDALYQAVSQISVPTTMIQIHYYYLYAVYYYNIATDYAVSAIENANSDYLAYAVAYVDAGTNARIEAVNLLNEYIAAHS